MLGLKASNGLLRKRPERGRDGNAHAFHTQEKRLMTSTTERTSAPPSKKAKPTEMDFKLVVDQAAALRSFVDIVSSVLRQVHINVVRHTGTGGGVCLFVDTVEENRVCMVQGRLVCSGELGENADHGFCVDMKTFQTALKSIPKHHSVIIQRVKGDSVVQMRSVDDMTKKVGLQFTVSTLDVEAETLDMGDIEFQYEIEADLGTLKSMFSMAKDIGCERITLSMLHEADHDDKIHLQISGKGTSAEFNRVVPSSSDSDTLSDVPVESMKLGTEAHFTLDYLSKVISKMEQQYVKVSMGTDLPLLLRCNLGVEDSFTHFVVAPKIE